MKSTLATACCILLGTLTAHEAIAQRAVPVATSGTRIGTLSCDVSEGIGLIVTSARTMSCTFQAQNGPQEVYSGTIRRFGLDLGVTQRSRLVWTVIAPTRRVEPGSLAGVYAGASADGSVVIGGGGNLLVGGSNNAISLQPLSLQAQTGINLAVGVSEFALTYVTPTAPRRK